MHRAVALEHGESRWEKLAEARAEAKRLTTQLAERDAALVTARDEVARLRAIASDLSADAQERASELCTARADAARLEGREKGAALLFHRLLAGESMESSARIWLAGCKS
jgi:predicted nuclease with TOPRIM domain